MEGTSPVKRMRLVFAISSDPRVNPGPLRRASRYITTARRNGLEAELRVAGDAVAIALSEEQDEWVRELVSAGRDEGSLTICEGCATSQGLAVERVREATGGPKKRSLDQVLIDVAEGNAVLIHLG